MVEKEFQVNEYIVLKLEEGKTNIYIKGKLFRQCKYLFILNPHENEKQWEINSIDEAAEVLNSSLERDIKPKDVDLSPEDEFWGHCSNIQAWVENNYDTRLLHTNIAFPLLKKLYFLKDFTAKRKFSEEIAKRYNEGSKNVREFLKEERFLMFLTKEHFYSLIESEFYNIIIKIEEGTKSEEMKIDVQNGKIIGLNLRTTVYDERNIKKIREYLISIGKFTKEKQQSLEEHKINLLPENKTRALPCEIKLLRDLESLVMYINELEEIPEWIGELKNLKNLEIYETKIKLLPPSICNLNSLETLVISNNKNLKLIPENIGDLKKLKRLVLVNNQIEFIPESVCTIKGLETLNIGKNNLVKLPDSIDELTSLKLLNCRKNKIKEIPKFLREIKIIF